MKTSIKTTLALLCFSALIHVSHADTIYIDPTYTGTTRLGTQLNPYLNWTDVPQVGGKLIAGNTYLQKRGTQAVVGATINLASNVTMGAYGSGTSRAWIYSTIPVSTRAVVLDDISYATIQDIKLELQHVSDVGANNGPTGIVIISKAPTNVGTGGHIIQRCEIVGGNVGINCGSDGAPLGFRISYCEVHHQGLDSIYLANTTNLEIDHCYIHHSNQNYIYNPTVAGGDAIQLDYGCQNAYIHHNLLDRSDTDFKFCFICESKQYPGGGALVSNNVVFEYNHTIAPIHSTSVWWHFNCNGRFQHNVIEGGMQGLYNENTTGDLLVYDNLFLVSGIYMGVTANSPFNFYNNTAVGVGPISGPYTTAANISDKIQNNIFYQSSGTSAVYRVGAPLSILTSDYNCFYPEVPGMFVWSGGWGGVNTLAAWKALGKDANSTNLDPLFLSLANKDFRLQTGSPCRGTGVVLPGISGTGAIDRGANYAALRNVQISDRPGVYLVPQGAVGGSDFIGYWTFDENTASTASDSSGNGNTGSIIGASWTTGKYGAALNFLKASGCYVSTGTNSMLNMGVHSFTLAAWIKPASTQVDGEWRGVFGGGGGAAGLGIKHSTRQLMFTKVNVADAPTSGVTIPLGVWTHAAITFDATLPTGNLKYYVNGTLVSTATFTQTFSAATNNIGCRAASSGYFDGAIDEVEIDNRVLSAAEIAEAAQ